MVNRLVSVGDDFTLPAAVKAADVNLPERLSEPSLSATYVPADLSPAGPTRTIPKPVYTMLTTFQSGHGWTSGGSAGSTMFADDTTDKAFGAQSVKGTTTGAGGNIHISKAGMTAADYTGKGVAVLLKAADFTKVGDIRLVLGSSAFANQRVIRLTPSPGGTASAAHVWEGEYQWFHGTVNDYSASVGTLNIAAVTDVRVLVYDRSAGAATLNVQAVATYQESTAYPNGVVTFSWDDNLLSQYTLGLPAFDKWGDACTAFVIQDIMGRSAANDNGAGGRFTIDQAKDLERIHGWEVGGHAYTLANHDAGFPNLAPDVLDKELRNLKSWLRANGFRAADYLAWPKGQNDKTSAAIMSKYFSIARHTNGTYAPLYLDNPMRVQAQNLASDTTVAAYKAMIDQAKLRGKWLIFTGHQVVASGATGNTNINVADLAALVDYCHEVGVPIRTMGKVLDDVRQPPATSVTNNTTALSAAQQETFDMMAAKSATSPWLLGDDFNRADNATGLGTAPSGQAWTNAVATVVVSGKKAKPSADANSTALVDVGASDYEASVTLNATATGGQKVLLYVRAVDGLNAIRCGASGASVTVERYTAGSATVLYTFPALLAGALSPRLTVKCLGDQLTFTLNGVSQTITETQGQTATKIGLNFTHTAVSADDLRVKTV